MSKIDDVMTRLQPYPIDVAARRDPTEGDLADFEHRLGGRLPSDYRRFLPQYGQMGLERGAVFEIKEPCPWGQRGSVDQFLGFSNNPEEDIVYATMDVYAGRIPDETIPIAQDAGGNLLLLGFDGAATDHVWFWDHEHRGLDAERIEVMRASVEAKGVDAHALDIDGLIQQWEKLYPEQRTKLPGYSNMYAVADSFLDFLSSLQSDSPDNRHTT